MKNHKMSRGRWMRYLPLYLMLLPGSIYLIINNYLPMAGTVVAFKKYNYQKGIFGSEWNGLKNFIFLFKTKDAWVITRNTICYNLVFIIVGTAAAITVAILLSEIKAVRARKTYQTLILLPFLVSIVVVSYIVYGFLSTEYGFVNHALESLGKQKLSWYSNPTWWPLILVLVNLWKNIGYNCVLYYATLMGIDSSYYEAAVVDGAGRWQRIRYITLPALAPTICILTLMSVSKIFYSDFGLFYQVPQRSGILLSVTQTIDTYVYRGLLERNDMPMATAAGVYQSIVGFILVMSANLVVRKIDPDSALF